MPIGWAITVVVLCVAVVALAIVVLGLLRQVTPVLERAAEAQSGAAPPAMGPEVGRPLPHFAGTGPDGEITDEQLRGQPSVLLFLSTGCGPCQSLARELRTADLGSLTARLVVVTEPDGPRELALPADLRVVTQRASEVSDPLSVFGFPFAIAVDHDGVVKATHVPNTVQHLESLAAAIS